MKGFGIEIKNDLLEPKHIEKMGVAVWLYMWCIDKITRIDDDVLGWVLGGKPITYQDVEAELGIPERTYTRWLQTLKNQDYIITTRTPKGLVLKVNKAYKHFNKGYAKSGVSDTPKVAEPSAINGGSFTIQLQGQYSKTVVGFEKFWNLYPKKTGKKPAEQKWNRLNKTTQELILADLPKRSKTEQWQKSGGQYVPNPATYLNQERWNDAIPEIKATGPASENWTERRIAEDREREKEQEQARMNRVQSERATPNSPAVQKFRAMKEKFKIG